LLHFFDILGSGWIKNEYFSESNHIDTDYKNSNPNSSFKMRNNILNETGSVKNLKIYEEAWETIQIVSRFYDANLCYQAIDWQKDIKSGYRWSESELSKSLTKTNKSGVDIKVPRELARFQHLTTFTLAYQVQKSSNDKNTYVAEYCSQILDFISNNPIGFGVNWQCTMDVALRAANWLVTYDMFLAFGVNFPPEFENLLIKSIYGHGLFIVNNLEWHPINRHNHYLTDIIGLLFISAYLPRNEEIDAWMAFSLQEMIKEIDFQFNKEGTNFEASTCYHRYSAELIIWAVALVLGLQKDKKDALTQYNHKMLTGLPCLKKAPAQFYQLTMLNFNDNKQKEVIDSPLPEWIFLRLEKMAKFVLDITKTNGKMIQVGDNDSGRFIKASALFQVMTVNEARRRFVNLEKYNCLEDNAHYYFENILDSRHLISAFCGLFPRPDFKSFSEGIEIERELIRNLSGELVYENKYPEDRSFPEQSRAKSLAINHTAVIGRGRVIEYEIILPQSISLKEVLWRPYPEFGIFIYRNQQFFLAIRCGPIGRNGRGGHAHNDQLAIELNISGIDWIVDPGTYVYTSAPDKRNLYRSVNSHFAPQYEGQEPASLSKGLFALGDTAQAKVLWADPSSFMGVHYGFGFPVYRYIELEESRIRVRDTYHCKLNRDQKKSFEQIKAPIRFVPYSPSYGYLEREIINGVTY